MGHPEEQPKASSDFCRRKGNRERLEERIARTEEDLAKQKLALKFFDDNPGAAEAIEIFRDLY